MDTLENNSDNALLAMAQYEWITYLTSNRMCLAIKDALLENKYMRQLFDGSIAEYKRDDFSSFQLPAISIYESDIRGGSKYYAYNAPIIFDIYLPIKLDRPDTTAVFNTISKAFINIIQSQPFWNVLNDKLVPLPHPSADNYEDVLRYKERDGSPLLDFGKKFEIIPPNKINIENIGDAWKLQIRTEYVFDLLNYQLMLEEFGIDGQVDPNVIFYQILQDFAVTVEPLIID